MAELDKHSRYSCCGLLEVLPWRRIRGAAVMSNRRLLLNKDACQRCRSLDLASVVARQYDNFATQDETWGPFLGLEADDNAAIMQRVLFDFDIPFAAECGCCVVLKKASEAVIAFRVHPDGDHSADGPWSFGLHDGWFEFARNRDIIEHYSSRAPSNGTPYSRTMGRGAPRGPYHGDKFGLPATVPPLPGASHAGYTVRLVPPRLNDYSLLHGWLETCEENHPGCAPVTSPKLATIKLIKLESRELIAFPADVLHVRFAALSYVWGDVPKKSFQLGKLPLGLPPTIEDAMTATQRLGLGHLWVDYVCIDQHDAPSKQQQISIMDTIYSGAYVTLVASTSESAAEGIPRVGECVGAIRQAHVSIGRGNKIVSRMPSLRSEMRTCPYSKRAWTYQESLLSRRKLIFTRHQVHFSCRTTVQCESVFETGQFDDAEAEANGGFGLHSADITMVLDGVSEDSDWRGVYGKIVGEYVVRQMSYETDALNAVSGILARLQRTVYPGGFAYGLPRDEFRTRLCWVQYINRHGYEPQSFKRRSCFPSWSWLGWTWATSPRWSYEHDDKKGYCPYCCLTQPPLSIRLGPDEEVDCENGVVCRRTGTAVMGAEAATKIQTFLQSLHPTDKVATSTPQWQTEGLTEVSGVIVQLPVILRQEEGERYDFTEEFRVLRHMYDRLALEKDLGAKAGASGLRVSFDGPIRDVVPFENVCTVVDCLLVAWSENIEVKERYEMEPVDSASDASRGEPEGEEKGDESRAKSCKNVQLSLVLLRWRDGVAYRAGFIVLSIDANDFIGNLGHLNPILTRFTMG